MKKNFLNPILLIGFSLLISCNSEIYQQHKPRPTEVQTDDIFVLSYNVCFNALTHNSTHGSAKQLGSKCVWDPDVSGITICANNMAKMIDGLLETYHIPNIDFIGLQEASNWDSFQAAAPLTMAKMSYLIAKKEKEYVVTLYDPYKYTLQYSMSGDLDYGRPYQISIFKEGVIFINLHNGHGKRFSYEHITKYLSNTLKNNLNPYEIEALESYRIIAVGDFNQILEYYRNQWSFEPFGDAGIDTKVEMYKDPPVTCCDTDGDMPWSGDLVGDFIFDSKHPAQPTVPSNYNNTELQSDHLPVVSQLK